MKDFLQNLLDLYQHLPSKVSPDFLSIGPFTIKWYSLGYVFAILTAYFIMRYRLKTEKTYGDKSITVGHVETLILFCVFGIIFGGRIGYYYIYGMDSFRSLWDAIAPFKNGRFQGYSGMSYHGGLVGVLVAFFIFSRLYKISFIKLLNLAAPGIALGYTWGRLGNFMNGELYGRITESPLGMYFVQPVFRIEEPYLRHPSQLYEAFVEGILNFCVLWLLRKREPARHYLAPIYLAFYGLGRFAVEYVRNPDAQFISNSNKGGAVFLGMTMGQTLSSLMVLFSVVMAAFIFYKRKKSVHID